MRYVVAAVAVLVVGTACGSRTDPGVATPAAATSVAAPFAKTWDVLIDEFATENIPIKTVDRASGIVASEMIRVAQVPHRIADCGREPVIGDLQPTNVSYNVLVRGDSGAASVRVNARWVHVDGATSIDCATTGIWETAMQQRIRDRAEGRPAAARAIESAPLPVSGVAPWVADFRGNTYYLRGCDAALAIRKENLISIASEDEAKKLGYKRSTAPGC